MGKFDEVEDSAPPPIRPDDFPAGSTKEPPKTRKPNGEYPPEEGAEDEFVPAEFGEDALAVKWVEHYGEDWRYVSSWDKWLEWDGANWRECETMKYFELSRQLTRQALTWAEEMTPTLKRRVNSASTASALLRYAKSDPQIAAVPSQWDTHKYLLGVPGGAVDLKSGKMIDGEREHYITMQTAVAPAKGEPVVWLAHLAKVLREDEDTIGFLRRYLGYMLTGDVGEHCLVFMFGTGRNGKGTIIETITHLMGDYGYAAPANILMESKSERHPAELAKLRGKRAVSASEPPQGARWDDGRIRWLTGGDTITARGMRENFYSFDPSHKLLVMGNHKPMLRAVDPAIKARFKIIDFSLEIPPEERDTKFAEKLKVEWPRILNWMIQGCLEWQDAGLGAPEKISRATDDYLEAEDTILAWLDECTERCDSHATSSSLYFNYKEWCTANGEHAWSHKAFSSALANKGFAPGKGGRGVRIIKGLLLRLNAPPTSD